MSEMNQYTNTLLMYDQAIWTELWREQLFRSYKCQEKNDLADFWSSKEKARDFWSKIKSQIDFYQPILDQIRIKPAERVLDIGGGPGTIAIPFAKKGADVTVVEPAKGMVAVLSENIVSENVSHISILNERWEDVSIEKLGESYDHIIACFSLGMPDIMESIQKMVSVSRGKIYLVWFSGLSSWDQMMTGLCSGACGSHYYSGPKTELLYLVLNQMGIHPDILNLHQDFVEKYDSLDSAISRMDQLCKVHYPGKKEMVQEWVQRNFIQEEGSLVWKARVTVSIISWEGSPKEMK